MSLSQPLYLLQQIDSDIDSSISRLSEIEVILSQNKEVQLAQKNTDKAEKILMMGNKELKSAEIDVETQNLKIEQNTKKTYSGAITSPKELGDLQQEAISLAKYLEVLEDIQLEKMLAHDDFEQSYQETEKILDATKDKAATESSMLKAEKSKLKTNVETQTNNRTTLVPKISADLYATYSMIKTKKGGVAVTTLKSDICAACGGKLTATAFQDAKSPNKITHCTTCKRIIHFR